MNTIKTAKIQFILSHELFARDLKFPTRLDGLREQLDNPVRYHSIERVQLGLQKIEHCIHDFASFAIELCEPRSVARENYQVALEAIEECWHHLIGQVPRIIWPPDGRHLPGQEEEEAEANAQLARIRRAVDSNIARCRNGANLPPRAPRPPGQIPQFGDLDEKPLGPLPRWVNMYQASAWVLYRTDRALVTLDRASLLHGEIRYSGVSEVNTLHDFETALQKGRPCASGVAGNDGIYVDIAPVAWTTMSAAPLFSVPVPYLQIGMRRDILVAVFPAMAALSDRKHRQHPKATDKEVLAWFSGLRTTQQLAAQSELYRLAIKDLPHVRVTHEQIRILTPGRSRGRKSKTPKSAS